MYKTLLANLVTHENTPITFLSITENFGLSSKPTFLRYGHMCVVCTLYNQYILLNPCCIAGIEEDLKLLHGDKVVHLSGTKDTIQRVTVHVPYTLRCGIRSNDYLVRITPLYRHCPRSIQKQY